MASANIIVDNDPKDEPSQEAPGFQLAVPMSSALDKLSPEGGGTGRSRSFPCFMAIVGIVMFGTALADLHGVAVTQ